MILKTEIILPEKQRKKMLGVGKKMKRISRI